MLSIVTYCCYPCPALDVVPEHSSRHTSYARSAVIPSGDVCVAHGEERDDFVN